MNRIRRTYIEDGVIYAVITLPNGQEYYADRGFKCRSTARRFAIKESNKHKWAQSHGMIYNTKGGG